MRLVFALLFTALFNGCSEPVAVSHTCVKGKYVGDYCEAFVFQLLDDNKIGKSWETSFGQTYTNCVVANVDTNYVKGTANLPAVKRDSIYYFQYREGSYPRKQYNICEPGAFIIITRLDTKPCTTDNSR